MLDRYENGLYAIDKDLTDRGVRVPFVPVIGDITDYSRVEAVLSLYKPSLVFHAAAHKHVPMMEVNPCEAIKNNIFGTWNVARATLGHQVEHFVLISTDKAVEPTSVMGMTKRVAEMLVATVGEQSTTSFVAVRFGNVLGSNGSVVPRFLEQIRAGGPVTVTHPQMRRYFMLIPEAVRLVIHAVGLGESGATYILDMGEQVYVKDIARNLIRLAGFTPDEDIKIVYTGVRPGEKLYEELSSPDETITRSSVDRILRVHSQYRGSIPDLEDLIRELDGVVHRGEENAAMSVLRKILSRNGSGELTPAANQGPRLL
jgi:FlaA1/EpsC-like NDP-sugar epimerase